MGDARESSTTTSKPTYFQPAEHLQHTRTLTAFPNLPGCYRSEESTTAARNEVAAIANAISSFEPVWLYADPAHVHTAQSLVNEKVVVKQAAVDNLWIRDLGPVFLHNRHTAKTEAAIDFNFNYWGHKAEETVDGTFARRILSKDSTDFSGIQRVQANIVSEGGALEVDGAGTLLVTDTSIVNDNRNPGRSQDEIEAELKSLMGVQKVIWLKGVNGLESTDWHVDAWCRFVRPGEVVLSKPPPNAHPEILAIFDDALEVLAREVDASGRKLKVNIIDEPDQTLLAGGAVDGMVTSYVNYLLVNSGVVMAKFGQEESDRKALEVMKGLFPDRKVVQVYINELPRLGGGIHCATQHIPA